MNVCLISGEYPPMQGGVGDYTRELGRALAGLGVTVHVLTSRRAAPGDPGLAVHPVVDRWGWRSLGLIRDVLGRVGADLAHVQYQTAAFGMHPAVNFLPAWLPLARSRARSVVTFHDLREPYLFPKAGRLRTWVNLRLAGSADAAIVTNEEDWTALAGRSALDVQRLELVPIGSNVPCVPPPGYDRAAWRARWGLDGDDLLLSYFGFFNASKGGETLVRALALAVEAGLPAFLVLVGGAVGSSDPTNVEYMARIDRLILDLGLSQRVFRTGFTESPEVSANLLASDVCVLPYRDGGSYRRGSLMAALEHGLPIVTTPPRAGDGSAGGRLPALVSGENVWLVPPDDPAALARAVGELAASPATCRRLAQGARRTAAAFGWDLIARQTLDVYREITGHG